MARGWAVSLILLASPLWAEQPKQRPDPKAHGAQQTQEQEPPEEDASAIPRVYSFDPLQARHELEAGNFYFKKGNYRAAAHRFEEAGKWNPGYAEAFLRLGEANEKLKDKAAAAGAYAKYLEISPDAKNAAAIRKKLRAKKN